MPTNEIIMICIFSVLLIVFGYMLFCMFKIFNRNNKQDEQCIILTKNDLEKMFSKSYLAREKKNRSRFMFLLLFSFITTLFLMICSNHELSGTKELDANSLLLKVKLAMLTGQSIISLLLFTFSYFNRSKPLLIFFISCCALVNLYLYSNLGIVSQITAAFPFPLKAIFLINCFGLYRINSNRNQEIVRIIKEKYGEEAVLKKNRGLSFTIAVYTPIDHLRPY